MSRCKLLAAASSDGAVSGPAESSAKHVGRTWDGVRAKGVEAGWLAGARMGGGWSALWRSDKRLDRMERRRRHVELEIRVQRRDDVIRTEMTM